MNIRRLIAFMLTAILCLCVLSDALAWEPGFTVYHGDREQKRICITVDDCKDVGYMWQIFNLSQELNVPITFFTLGYVLENTDRDLWLAIAASNCEIGNHTYYHNTLPKQSHTAGVNALLRTQAKLDEVLGYHYQMQVMRPPYGEMQDASGNSSATIQIIQDAGYSHAILWDGILDYPEDCYRSVQNGSIMLFHALKDDVTVLTEILPWLIEDGYEFVTVSEMLGLPPVTTSTDLFVLD
ncbi:MAG: polysaccharide deacetylase family protein [Clostridiales bacterium]|nr:polysaccharide deacetylase family protein [Clostridiales bacterium]